MLTMPGHEPWEFALRPEGSNPSSGRWSLKIAFKRSRAAVMRQRERRTRDVEGGAPMAALKL
jgi:hypothetical protein